MNFLGDIFILKQAASGLKNHKYYNFKTHLSDKMSSRIAVAKKHNL
jgi:hypothetical protein